MNKHNANDLKTMERLLNAANYLHESMDVIGLGHSTWAYQRTRRFSAAGFIQGTAQATCRIDRFNHPAFFCM